LIEKKMQPMLRSIPGLCLTAGFLLAYALVVFLIYRPNKFGRRRRWHFLDFVWVPLGGLTGLILLSLFWRAHASM
jgi:hypothetical protein